MTPADVRVPKGKWVGARYMVGKISMGRVIRRSDGYHEAEYSTAIWATDVKRDLWPREEAKRWVEFGVDRVLRRMWL